MQGHGTISNLQSVIYSSKGEGFYVMKAREVMTTDVISVREDSGIEEAARLLARYRISGVPVVNNAGSLVGLATEYDLISKSGQNVADVMTRGIISVSPDTEL